MKDYLVDAIILKSIKAREADRVLTLFTRQLGKIRVMAHGVEKPASRKRGAVQPFSYSRLLLRRGRDIDSVSQGEGIEIFPALRQSLDGIARASYMAELADMFTPEEDPHPDVFELLLDTFSMLGHNCDQGAVRAFEIKLVSCLGYRPNLDNCVLCGLPVPGERVCFAPGQGGIVCEGCSPGVSNGLLVSRGSLETLKALLRWETGRIGQIRINPGAGGEIKSIMSKFIEYHIEKGIRSA
ncbi:MAG: DNA repair protein RecO, partial [Desulfocucumaceae bacterium]